MEMKFKASFNGNRGNFFFPNNLLHKRYINERERERAKNSPQWRLMTIESIYKA